MKFSRLSTNPICALAVLLCCSATNPSVAQVNTASGSALDVTNLDLPTQALAGTLCGTSFGGATAKLSSSINDSFSLDHLVLSTANQSIDIQFPRKYSLDSLANQTLIFTPAATTDNVTVKITSDKSANQTQSFNAYSGVGLKIKFGTY